MVMARVQTLLRGRVTEPATVVSRPVDNVQPILSNSLGRRVSDDSYGHRKDAGVFEAGHKLRWSHPEEPWK
jgi:hypothetical protein